MQRKFYPEHQTVDMTDILYRTDIDQRLCLACMTSDVLVESTDFGLADDATVIVGRLVLGPSTLTAYHLTCSCPRLVCK